MALSWVTVRLSVKAMEERNPEGLERLECGGEIQMPGQSSPTEGEKGGGPALSGLLDQGLDWEWRLVREETHAWWIAFDTGLANVQNE